MKVTLTVDNKTVKLNPYVELVFSRVVEALMSTLKDMHDWEQVCLEMKK